MITFLIVLAVVWLISAIANYLCMRHEHRQAKYRTWDNANRCAVIFISLMGGPVFLFGTLIVFILDKFADSAWGKREVRW